MLKLGGMAKGDLFMHRLEVFFDYVCPFCLKGHVYLKELMSRYPQLEIAWRPCEAHPRPERFGLHSDLCIQGMFFAQDQGADLWEYHDRMFRAALTDRADIEDINVLSEYVRVLLDPVVFRQALRTGQYAQTQLNANRYAFEQSGVWVVPSYRMNGGRLDSVENIGVTKPQLASFLTSAK